MGPKPAFPFGYCNKAFPLEWGKKIVNVDFLVKSTIGKSFVFCVTDFLSCVPTRDPFWRLWAILAQKLQGKVYTSRQALWNAIEQAALAIPPSTIQTLYASIPKRLQAVVWSHGGHTRY